MKTFCESIERTITGCGSCRNNVGSIFYPHSLDQTMRHKTEAWGELKSKFASIGITGHVVDSMALIPLIETALDDKIITGEEKDKMLSAMSGLRLLTHGMDPKLSQLWVPFKDRTGFLIIWTVYLRDLGKQFLYEDRVKFKALVIDACTFMMRTIGGFLKVKNLDDRVRKAIDNAFAYFFMEASPAVQYASTNEKTR
jgi:hypothetical protein